MKQFDKFIKLPVEERRLFLKALFFIYYSKILLLVLPFNTDSTTEVILGTNMLTPAPGGGLAHDNLMPFLCVSYIICLVGLYPSFS